MPHKTNYAEQKTIYTNYSDSEVEHKHNFISKTLDTGKITDECQLLACF